MTESENQPLVDEPTAVVDGGPNEPSPDDAEESTVGTGTFFALGCTGITIILILLGIVVILLVR